MSNDNINYYKLQIEYSEYKKESDELIKEYESSTGLLSDSVDQLTTEKDKIEKQCETLLAEKNKLQFELDSIKDRNMDKMKDIEIMNSKLEQYINEIKTIKEEKERNQAKIITLETDNDYYLGKMRENESLIEEQKEKMENALEDLISLQTEFDGFKIESEEKIQRLERQIQEEKSNSQMKDIIIQRRSSGLGCNFKLDEALDQKSNINGNSSHNDEIGIEGENSASNERKELLNALHNRIQRRKYELEQYIQEVDKRLKINAIDK